MVTKKNYHQTVLLEEAIELLGNHEGWYIDGTLGGGGHSRKLLESNPRAKLIGIDKDARAIKVASENLKEFSSRLVIIKDDFKNFQQILAEKGIEKISGFLVDLGVSSHHFDEAARGFSYHNEGPLDMRMDQEQKLSAYDLVNGYSKEELAKIIFAYGEEKWARSIANWIVKEREEKPLETTTELAEIIKKAIPLKARQGKGHPARKTFQALRVYINNELEDLVETIERVVERLEVGGRICIISFHSLEDRLVKQTFNRLSTCQCPRQLPCQCGGPILKTLTRRPVVPTDDEIKVNPRSRSAKLRAGEKLLGSKNDWGSIK